MKRFFILVLIFSTSWLANGQPSLVKTEEGFQLKADLMAGQYADATIQMQDFEEVTYVVQLHELASNDDYPAGVNFKFANEEDTFFILLSFIKQPSVTDAVIMSTEFWLNDKKLGEDIAAISEITDLGHLSLTVKWSLDRLDFTLNESTNFHLNTPIAITKTSYSMQSSSGIIDAKTHAKSEDSRSE